MTRNQNRISIRRVRVALASVLLAFLGACAGSRQTLSAPPVTMPALEKTGYRIAPGDNLIIKLYYHPELNTEAWVRPDGFISLELVGEIHVSGQTPAEIDSVLETEYGHKLVNPEVAVMVKNSITLKVYVGGEVQSPGLVSIDGGMTLLGAIFQAGGFKSSAQLSQIVLLRKDDRSNQPLTLTLDVREALQGKHAQTNVALNPYDVIYVPKSGIARANQFMDSFIEGLLPMSTLSGFAWVYALVK